MKKLIYLEDAIEAIKDADVLVFYDTGTDTDDACELAIRATKGSVIESVKVLSEADPEQRWIPVTERLPEPNTRCLVTTEDGYIDIDDYYIYGWDDNCDTVIAWMPMPIPYKEDSKCQK